MSNRAYYILLLTTGFLVPLTLILVAYGRIIASVVSPAAFGGPSLSLYPHHYMIRQMRAAREMAVMSLAVNKSPLGGALKKLRRQMDVRTAQIVVMLIIVYLVAWTPYAVVTFIGQFAPIDHLNDDSNITDHHNG